MSLARRYQNDPCEVVCIVGDGAMTAGMAFEAMNDAVAHDADLIVVLNDNDMSISCSTGGFAKHLAAIWEKGHLVNVNEHGEAYIQPHPKWTYNSRLHQSATDAADNLFKAIGFDYFGPFDGHDVNQLVQVFNALKKRKGPRLVHVYTKKAKALLLLKLTRLLTMRLVKLMQLQAGKPHQSIRMFLVNGYAMKLLKMSGCLRSHLLCVKARAWLSLPSNSPNVSLMSQLQSSMP